MRGPAFFAYANNYLIDVKFGVIMDVEASRAIRQAEVGAAKTMIERTEQRFDIKPERLAADTAYGTGANLNWCQIPECGGISQAGSAFRERLWARYFMAAPRLRTPSELRYSDRRLRSKI